MNYPDIDEIEEFKGVVISENVDPIDKELEYLIKRDRDLDRLVFNDW